MRPAVGRVVVPVSSGALGALLALSAAEVLRKPPPATEAVTLAPVAAASDGRLAATGKGGQYVSLSSNRRQRVEPNTWTQLRFDREHADRPGWHRAGSAHVVPTKSALALVCYKVTWISDPRPRQYFAQIARDPNRNLDVTGGETEVNGPGRDYRALCWSMKVRKGQPLAIRVKHDGSRASSVVHAQFKVWIP